MGNGLEAVANTGVPARYRVRGSNGEPEWSQRLRDIVIDLIEGAFCRADTIDDVELWIFAEVDFDVPVLIIKDSRDARRERFEIHLLLLRSLPWQCLTLILSHTKSVLIALKTANCRDSDP